MKESKINADRKHFADRVRKIVRDGAGIREEVAGAVRDAGTMLHETGESLADIAKSVLDEAVGAASTDLDSNRSGKAVREVIDGIGDGLSSAAQAVDLAVTEARGRGEEFARDDLGGAARDLRSIAGMLVETTERAVRGVGGHLEEQVSGLIEHAELTAKRVLPELESAASAAAGDKTGMVKGTASAGVAAARQGVGALLAAVGGILEKSGEALKKDEK